MRDGKTPSLEEGRPAREAIPHDGRGDPQGPGHLRERFSRGPRALTLKPTRVCGAEDSAWTPKKRPGPFSHSVDIQNVPFFPRLRRVITPVEITYGLDRCLRAGITDFVTAASMAALMQSSTSRSVVPPPSVAFPVRLKPNASFFG